MSNPPARRGLLNSAATFLGIGQGLATPTAAKPKGDDDEMTAEERATKERADKKEKARRARNKKAGRDEDDDGEDGPGDDDNEDKDKDKDGDDDPDAVAAAEDADDEEGNRKGSATQAARMAERARCAAIFATPHALGREQTAARLAFSTTMPRHQAIAVLASTPKEKAGAGLSGRMAGQPQPTIGAGAEAATPAARAKAGMMDAFYHHAVTTAKRPGA